MLCLASNNVEVLLCFHLASDLELLIILKGLRETMDQRKPEFDNIWRSRMDVNEVTLTLGVAGVGGCALCAGCKMSTLLPILNNGIFGECFGIACLSFYKLVRIFS